MWAESHSDVQRSEDSSDCLRQTAGVGEDQTGPSRPPVIFHWFWQVTAARVPLDEPQWVAILLHHIVCSVFSLWFPDFQSSQDCQKQWTGVTSSLVRALARKNRDVFIFQVGGKRQRAHLRDVVSPIDLTHSASDNTYRLRTTRTEIHLCLSPVL